MSSSEHCPDEHGDEDAADHVMWTHLSLHEQLENVERLTSEIACDPLMRAMVNLLDDAIATTKRVNSSKHPPLE